MWGVWTSGGSSISHSGVPTWKVGAKTYYLGHFSLENCMKLKKIGPRGGCPGAPPPTLISQWELWKTVTLPRLQFITTAKQTLLPDRCCITELLPLWHILQLYFCSPFQFHIWFPAVNIRHTQVPTLKVRNDSLQLSVLFSIQTLCQNIMKHDFVNDKNNYGW